jgi:hypothetical protein
MAWVHRDDDGKITGVFGALQPGYPEEELPDDNEDVLAFFASIDSNPTPKPSLEFTKEALTAGFKAMGYSDSDVKAFFTAAEKA